MLTAIEWYQQVEMHVRHHLRQKKELEGFVNISSTEFTYKNAWSPKNNKCLFVIKYK